MGKRINWHMITLGELLVAGVLGALPARAEHCTHCGAACEASRLVAYKVQVPVTVIETRMTSRVVQESKQREETYTVFKRVPETRKITKDKWYLDDEVRTKTITEKKCRQVQNPVSKVVNVNVLEPEVRETTVQNEVCTLCGKICVEETCACTVMRSRPDVRTEECEVPDVVFETTKRDIDYCVKVPKKETITCAEETTYKLVPVEKTRTVDVCVPKIIKEPVEVEVQKMVTKTILCCEKCSHRHRH